MKRLAFVLAVLAVAACSKTETPKADTTPPAMAPTPAPAMADSAAMKMADSVAKAKADSAHKDSVAKKLIKP